MYGTVLFFWDFGGGRERGHVAWHSMAWHSSWGFSSQEFVGSFHSMSWHGSFDVIRCARLARLAKTRLFRTCDVTRSSVCVTQIDSAHKPKQRLDVKRCISHTRINQAMHVTHTNEASDVCHTHEWLDSAHNQKNLILRTKKRGKSLDEFMLTSPLDSTTWKKNESWRTLQLVRLHWVVMIRNLFVLLHEEERQHRVPTRTCKIWPKSVEQRSACAYMWFFRKGDGGGCQQVFELLVCMCRYALVCLYV